MGLKDEFDKMVDGHKDAVTPASDDEGVAAGGRDARSNAAGRLYSGSRFVSSGYVRSG